MESISRVHLDVTGKCNLRCKHCHMADFYSNDYSTSEILHILDIIKKKRIERIALAGGEPLIRKDFLKIIEHCPKEVSILTNGTLISSQLINSLRKIEKKDNKIITFRISLDGLGSHKKVRGINFKEILKKIKIIREAQFITVVNTTLSPFIQTGELLKMLDLLEELKVDQWNIDIPFIEGSFKNNHLSINLDLCLGELKEVIRKYLANDYFMKLDIVSIFSSELIKKNNVFPVTNISDHPCNYQLKSITINPRGDLLLCPSLHIPFGNIKNLENYREEKKWKEFINHKRSSPNGCGGCRYLRLCGGGCRANSLTYTGELWGKDILSCKIMNFLEKELIPLYSNEVQRQFKENLLE